MKHIFCAIRILNELCMCKFSTATNGIECGVLSAIPNGVITFSPDSTPDYDLYTTATYSCNQNYTLSGNGLLTCINAFGSGTWDNFEPSCMGKQCTCNIVLGMRLICGHSFRNNRNHSKESIMHE